MAVSAVIFDLDDTLYLEFEYVRSGFMAVSRHLSDAYGIVDFFSTAMQLFHSGARGTVFDQALLRLGVASSRDLIDELVRNYREHQPEIALLPDARELLAWAQGRASTGIITDGPSVTQNMKLDALGLRTMVNLCICTDDYGREFWKPHPRAFRAMEESLGCAGGKCVYIADNARKDFAAPNALGWRTIQVVRPGAMHAGGEVQAGGAPERVVVDLREVPEILRAHAEESSLSGQV